MKGITVCVEYDDLLAITLPLNARHLSEIVVVTAPHDQRTKELVQTVPNARCFVTDAFYRQGAKFNKGAAMEEGLTFLGRTGWIIIHDADTLFPDVMPLNDIQIGNLYTPHRRMLTDPSQWTPDFDWTTCYRTNEGEFPGYFQLFHAADPVLVERPWYDVKWIHAGGCDSIFQDRWPIERKIRPNFEVLHLGEDGKNWFGRATKRLDGIAIPEAETRAARIKSMFHNRRRQKHRYRGEKLP